LPASLGKQKKPGLVKTNPGFRFKKSGNTYFRTFGTIIGSESLSTVFGMGTGVTFPIWLPEETWEAMKPPHAFGLVVL
jgi:hypothetical protein